jgi:DNA-binding beta-propeller fold protein YncE
VGTIARFFNPAGVSISPDGVYALVGDTWNHLIRLIVISTASVTTLAGVAGAFGSTNGVGTIARFNGPIGVSISPDGVYALVADQSNRLIRHIIISTASVTTLAGVAVASGSTNGVGTISRFNLPHRVSISPDGVYALVADTGNHLIRHIIISTASVTTLAGVVGSTGSTNGMGTIARFNNPAGVSISPDGVYALVADRMNHLIRHIVISTASVTTLAGVAGSSGSTNGVGTIARFNYPVGVSISPDGVYALVGDRDNHLVRQIVISTATSTPSTDVFPSPAPSFSPTSLPSVPPITRFSFGVKIGDEGILSPGKAILVDYLQDARRGQTLLLSPLSSLCHRLISLCSREDDSHLSCCQRLSRLLSFRPSVVIGFHSHQVASRDSSSRDRILGQRRQPHDHHDSWRRRCVGVLARESPE